MFKSLYGKLVFWLFIILSVVSIALVSLVNVSVPLYQHELNQKLHSSLAKNLVKSHPLLKEQNINHKSLKSIFDDLMNVNPAIEVYLLDSTGKILEFSAPPGKVKLKYVNLTPVKSYINHSPYPIKGDNPRSFQEQKVFSAAPIYDNNKLEGYLYIVLGGDAYDSIGNMIKGSYILQQGVISIALILLITLIAGIIIFNVITRRLRFLNDVMEKFKQTDFQQSLLLPAEFDGRSGDEITHLGRTFREMAERINQQMDQLKATDASRRELVANVSHDLRTPLSSLQGYLETLDLKAESLTENERKEYVHIALKQSERLGRLIKELFELAMLDNQSSPVQHESFSLSELAQDVVQKYQNLAKDKNLIIETDFQDNAFVSADIALIERVFENLLENAIKYTPKGGNVKLSIKSHNNSIFINVSDTGIGIPESDIPHIFERFYRVDKSRTNAAEGTGLGLAIANRILQLHNSIMDVKSEVDKGTEFSFSLPTVNLSA